MTDAQTEERPAHSPVGGSAASRILKCAGSVNQSKGAEDPEDDTFSAPGQAAHSLAEACLLSGVEPWELIGEDIPTDTIKVPVDKEMADAVATYLNWINSEFPDRNQGNTWVERKFYCPTIHPLFFGASDFVHLRQAERKLDIADYKHGAGIVVEVENNAQGMYYAAGVLEDLKLWDDVDEVTIHIVQPRAFHFDGPIRSWTIKTEELVTWLEDKMVPGIKKALVSRDTTPGEHCRFCPARFNKCPGIWDVVAKLEKIMAKAMEKGMGDLEKGAAALTSEEIGQLLTLGEVFKIARTAAVKTGTARLNAGHVIPGWKLSPARANRVFKEGADKEALKVFGDKALTEPKIKSPAQIEEMPGGKAFTTRWAYKPDAGLTLTEAGDPRPAVNVDVKTRFKNLKTGK